MADGKRNEEQQPPRTEVTPPPEAAEVERDDAVKNGGIARSDADVEDVSRDTYGGFDEESEPDKPTRKERFAEAERTAEEEGIPGVVLPK